MLFAGCSSSSKVTLIDSRHALFFLFFHYCFSVPREQLNCTTDQFPLTVRYLARLVVVVWTDSRSTCNEIKQSNNTGPGCSDVLWLCGWTPVKRVKYSTFSTDKRDCFSTAVLSIIQNSCLLSSATLLDSWWLRNHQCQCCSFSGDYIGPSRFRYMCWNLPFARICSSMKAFDRLRAKADRRADRWPAGPAMANAGIGDFQQSDTVEFFKCAPDGVDIDISRSRRWIV